MSDEIKIEYSDDIDVPDICCAELEVDDKLRVINKRKWERQKKYAEKKFQKIRKEIEDR